ncbi:MAG: endolytic transglycosylase MltG [Mogibacterium sp.]|nr:endolytic transglycosylase MltG [Mogibacterium sp.]
MEDPSNQTIIENKTTASGNSGINKRFLKPLRIIIVILAVVFAVLLSFYFISRPYDRTCSTFTNVMVEEGEDLAAVSARLEEAGIVSSSSAFSLVSRCLFLTDFKPGTYFLSPSMNLPDIARTMVRGLTISNGFSIPAGYSLDQIVTSLARDGFIDTESFMKSASSTFLQDIDFIGNDIEGPQQIEGFLFPDEYAVSPAADETMIIMTMLDRFSNFFNEDYRARADELDMSIREIVVIASMIETETTLDKERAEISAVIHNRLNMGLYAEGEFPEIPLCSPGEASIIAALYPAENENIYYIWSDSLDGSHVFTADEAEYQQLVEKYNQAIAEREEG